MADIVGSSPSSEGWAVVLGYGSVGRRHARVAGDVSAKMAIVERADAARQAARENHPSAVVVESLSELDRWVPSGHWPHASAVIATWGPSHAELFHALADRGLRRVLCEKPMASSVGDAVEMEERARRDGIILAVHHYIRYAGLAPALRRRTDDLSLGAPVSLLVRGGAACLVTNGIHWLDFACELFGSDPQFVVSSAVGEAINPRSPDLRIYGGTASWGFGGGREAVMALSNRSSLALEARVYYRDAVVDIDGDLGVRARRRDPAEVERFPVVTRTGPAEETLFEGALPGVLGYLEGMTRAFSDVRSSPDATRLTCPAARGVNTVSGCVGALLAARTGARVDLPLAPGSEGFDEQWPIS